MNKEEVYRLAIAGKATVNEMSSDVAMNICMTEDALLAFANACEKIGMEKAAKENSELRKAAMRVLDAPYAKSGVEFIRAMKQLDSIVTGTPTNAACEAAK